MVMICPYCDTEINEKQMEAEDGCCPECGAVLTQSNILSDTDDEVSNGYSVPCVPCNQGNIPDTLW